jgi:ATP-dependent Lon protease
MFVEAVAMPGQGRVSLTGQLGDVMKESAQAAVSYVRSRLGDWLLSPGWFKERDLHIHLPQGAIPKDGPSAGVALATAVVSLVSGLKVKPDVAMTGEISLRGLVLPVGGLKEKLLAAKWAGLSTVLVPARNRPDIKELSASVTGGLEIGLVDTLDQVLEKARSRLGFLGREALSPAKAPGGERPRLPRRRWSPRDYGRPPRLRL